MPLDALTKLIRLKTAVDQNRKLEEKALAPANQITSDMKYIRSQQAAQQKQQLDGLKYITGRYTDLYFKANNNRALQENILQTMQGIKSQLPPAFRQQFDLFTKAGPFSPVAEKKRQWKKLRGDRPADISFADSDNLLLIAQTKFSQMDYDAEKQHFLTGQAPVGPKRRTVGIDKDNLGVRGEDGIISLVSTEAYLTEELAGKLGKNLGTLVANDFKEVTDTKKFISNGMEYETKTAHDYLTGQKVSKTTAGKKLAERQHWESDFLTNTLVYVTTGQDDIKNPAGFLAKRMIEHVGKTKNVGEAEAALNAAVLGNPKFHNIYLSVTDEEFDAPSMFEWNYGLSGAATIIPIYGEQVPFNTSDGQQVVGLWDKQMDIVHAADGTRLGSYQDAAAFFAKRHSTEFFGER